MTDATLKYMYCSLYKTCAMMAALCFTLSEVKRKRQPLWKFPCSVCCKLVKCNQKGFYCDLWNRRCQSRCSNVSITQYTHLSVFGSATPWYCHTCTLQQLPFANFSFVSETASSVSGVTYDENHPLLCNSTVVLCHINISSLMPAFDEFNNFLVNFQRPVVLGITEIWLSSTVSLHEVSFPGFSTYRFDCDSRGGVLVYVHVSHSCRSWRRFDL